MDTEALRWFQQVADGVRVTEVGELYRVTQSGVSRGLARLEAEIGTPLLRRSGRTLRMTRAGAAFKRHVDALLNDLDDGLAAVDQLVDPETGTVALAFQLSLGTWLVPGLISSFRSTHPGVRFALTQARDELVSAVLAGGRVDLEITALRPVDGGVRWARLLTQRLCLAVRDDHPLARLPEVDLAQASGEQFVTLRPASLLRRQWLELCERAGFRPVVAFEGDDLPTITGFVAAGLGVAVVPGVAAAGQTEPGAGRPEREPVPGLGAVSLVPLSDPLAVREVGLAWSAERRLLPATELFRRHVIDEARGRRLPGVRPRPPGPGPARSV